MSQQCKWCDRYENDECPVLGEIKNPASESCSWYIPSQEPIINRWEEK